MLSCPWLARGPQGVVQSHPHTGHVQEVQCPRDSFVQLFKGFQAGLRQCLCLFPGQNVQPMLLCLQMFYPLLGRLDQFQLLPGFLPERDDILDRITILPFELINEINALLDLIQFGVIGLIGVQTADQVCSSVFCIVVKIQQLPALVESSPSSWAAASTALEASPSRSTAPGVSSSPESSA